MPIDKENLEKRKWPLPPGPIGQEVIGRKKKKLGTYDEENGLIAKNNIKNAATIIDIIA